MALVYLSISSNFNRAHHIKAALVVLKGLYSELEVSDVYRNQPLKGSGDDYFNLALKLSTTVSQQALIAKLKEIENSLGRVRGKSASIVNIDIDLLSYEGENDNFVCHDICEKSYLLKPLADIAGEKIEPVSGLNYRQLWAAFDQSAHPLFKVEIAL